MDLIEEEVVWSAVNKVLKGVGSVKVPVKEILEAWRKKCAVSIFKGK